MLRRMRLAPSTGCASLMRMSRKSRSIIKLRTPKKGLDKVNRTARLCSTKRVSDFDPSERDC